MMVSIELSSDSTIKSLIYKYKHSVEILSGRSYSVDVSLPLAHSEAVFNNLVFPVRKVHTGISKAFHIFVLIVKTCSRWFTGLYYFEDLHMKINCPRNIVKMRCYCSQTKVQMFPSGFKFNNLDTYVIEVKSPFQITLWVLFHLPM